MRTIIAGSRDLTVYALVDLAVCASGFRITEVVSGDAPSGIDKLGELWAYLHRIPLRRFPADWRKWGKPAGPIRNGEMARYANALVAIWDGRSPGTKNMIKQAHENHLQVYAVRAIWDYPVWRLEPVEYSTTI